MREKLKVNIIYNYLILSLGTIFSAFMFYIFFINTTLILSVFDEYLIEILFLFITGNFLYSFKYEIMSVKITFNAFIIYVSYNIICNTNAEYIYGVYFFIFVFFIFQLVIEVFDKKEIIEVIDNFYDRFIMWTFLIFVFHKVNDFIHLELSHFYLRQLLIIPLYITIHLIIKAVVTITERLFQSRYYNFYYHTLPFIFFDSLFIFFSIIIGNVYNKIGIFNTAMFISFLVITISLVKYTTQFDLNNIIFYSMHSFLPVKLFNRMYKFNPNLPIFNQVKLDKIIDKKVSHLIFISIYFPGGFSANKIDWDTLEKNNIKFYSIKNLYLCSVIADCDLIKFYEMKDEIIKLHFDQKTKIAYTKIHRTQWSQINTNYIFRILTFTLKNKKSKSENNITTDYIFS